MNPGRAVHIAELAFAASESLPPHAYPESTRHDIQARALAFLANARRATGDFSEAERLLEESMEHLQLGSGMALELGYHLFFAASLATSKEDYGRGRALFSRATRAFLKAGNDHLAGLSLIGEASGLAVNGDVEAATETVERGLVLIDQLRSPHATAVARHMLAYAQLTGGNVRAAESLATDAAQAYRRCGEHLSLLRLRFVQARIATQQGRLNHAEHLMRQVRQEYLRRHLKYPAAAAALELAKILLKQGRLEEIEALASETVRVCGDLGMSREAEEALGVIRRSIDARCLEPDLIERLRDCLETAHQSGPPLRFEPAI